MPISRFDLQKQCKEAFISKCKYDQRIIDILDVFIYQKCDNIISFGLRAENTLIYVSYPFLIELSNIFKTDKICVLSSGFNYTNQYHDWMYYEVSLEIKNSKIEIDWTNLK